MAAARPSFLNILCTKFIYKVLPLHGIGLYRFHLILKGRDLNLIAFISSHQDVKINIQLLFPHNIAIEYITSLYNHYSYVESRVFVL